MQATRKWPTFHQRYTRNLLTVVLPLIVLLALSSFYSIRASNEKVAESNRRMVGYWAEQTGGTLGTIEMFLSNLTLNEQELSVLSMREKPDTATHTMLSLLDRFDTASLSFSALTGLFCHSEPNSLFADRFANPQEMSYEQRERIRRFIRNKMENGDVDTKRWVPYLIGDQFYLLRFFVRDGASVAAAVDIRNLTPGSLDDKVTVAYRRLSDGAMMAGGEFVADEGIRLGVEGEPYYFTGSQKRYMVIEEPFEKAGFSMAFILAGSGFWDSLDTVQTLLLVLSALSIVLVIAAHRWLESWLNGPIRKLTEIMERIKRGELTAQIETPFHTHELVQVRDTFNDMMSQIRALKIDAYEREIDRQHVELQYLHLQIRPHFFLNFLKSLYACAQQQKIEQMQEMILSISQHIRYWFRDTLTTVSLSEEIRFALNYIRIQQLCLVPAPTYALQMDEALETFQIPPFTVQTFVENAVKHEWHAGHQLHIVIKAQLLSGEDGTFANITVADNGDGFPDSMLETLNNPETPRYAERHIGLNNIKQRLKLIYGDSAVTAFYNNPGSICEIILPVKEEEA